MLVPCEYPVVLVLDAAIPGPGGAGGVTMVAFTPAAFASGSPAIGIMFCFFAFIGFEATTIYGEEACDPRRTIPVVTYLSVGLICTVPTRCLAAGVGADRVTALVSGLADPTLLVPLPSERYVGMRMSPRWRCCS